MNKSLEEWFLRTQYNDRSYGLQLSPGYVAHIVTGLYNEDTSVEDFDLPIIKDKYVLMDLKKPNIKSNMNIYDNIEEFVSHRAKGGLKINCAKLMVEDVMDKLSYLKKDMMRVYGILIKNIVSISLSLDVEDSSLVEDIAVLYFISRNWDIESMSNYDRVSLFRMSRPNSELLSDEYVASFLDKKIDRLETALVDGINNHETNRRLKVVSESDLTIMLQTLLTRDLVDFTEGAMNNLPILMAIFLEAYTNVFYKNTKLGIFLKSNARILNIKDLIKEINSMVSKHE